MATPLIPQEIYLLERYTSIEYFGDMRDAWQTMLDFAERALDVFVHHLPADYRKRPLPYQPDITWGEVVLVNFRDTQQYLNEAFIKLRHGDLKALYEAGSVLSDEISFRRDYSAEWMSEPQVIDLMPGTENEFYELLGLPGDFALNIESTVQQSWTIDDLRDDYVPGARGPLNPPPEWPTYRTNPAIRVATNAPVPRSGIYLPDADESCAAFLIAGEEAAVASIGYNPDTMQRASKADTIWTFVERVADIGGGVPGAADPIRAGIRLRCEAGGPCPRAGYWFTPARDHSRRRFAQGETMPAIASDYGATIWQWDEKQD